MIVILPVCHKDAEAALRNLEWTRYLDGRISRHCVVSHDTSFDAGAVIESARSTFTQVTEHTYCPPKNLIWPAPQNAAWQSAALHVFLRIRRPWLWWEQDAVPIRKGWLASLAEAYGACGKPFMGALSTLGNVWHLTGIAVYPPNIPQRQPDMMLAVKAPFDAVGCAPVLAQSALTPLIQVNNQPGGDLVWDWEDSLSVLQPETVLFHRCKDDGLFRALQRRAQPGKRRRKSFFGQGKIQASPVSDVTVVITNYQRPEMLWEAYQSTRAAHVAHVVISSSGVTAAVQTVLDKIKKQSAAVKISARSDDAG